MFNIPSSHRHVKTALLHFILDIATLLLTHVAQYLTEYPLQRIALYLTTTGSIWVLHRLIAVIANIEGGAIEVAGVLRCITVTTAQFHHIVLRTEHAGDNQLMQGHSLHIKTVEEGPAYIL